MPPLPGYWHSLLARHGRVWKAAYKQIGQALDAKLAARTNAQAEYIAVRAATCQQIHPVARLRQAHSGWVRHVHTAVRSLTTDCSPIARSGIARSSASHETITWNAVRRSTGRVPFASTLRPSLTGGTLGRTAGGYSIGGGRAGAHRYFSHGPASQAQVVQNVSQAVRAFMLGGQRAHFDGVDTVTGNKHFKAVTKLQYDASRMRHNMPKMTPSSHVEFAINPTITALTSLSNVTAFSGHDNQHLNTDGLLDVLSADFSRSLKDLAAVLGDLRRLSQLGDMPITCHRTTLRIHFPGCDAGTVERLCSEANVQRGIVIQEDDFDAIQDDGLDAHVGTEMALLFPFAPSSSSPVAATDDLFGVAADKSPNQSVEQIDWRELLSPVQSSCHSTQSHHSGSNQAGCEVTHELEDGEICLSPLKSNGWSVHDHGGYFAPPSPHQSHLEYQGIEAIYRFIEQCDAATAARRG